MLGEEHDAITSTNPTCLCAIRSRLPASQCRSIHERCARYHNGCISLDVHVKHCLSYHRRLGCSRGNRPATRLLWLTGNLDRLQLFPARVEASEVFLGGGEIGDELAGLSAVRAVEIGRGEERFDAGDLGFDGVDLRFHAFELTRFLPGELARA